MLSCFLIAFDALRYDESGYAQEAYQYPQAKAVYDYAAEAETDLSFYTGDTINILDDTDPRYALESVH